MTQNKEIRILLQKFALNQCNAEEIEKLIAYFKSANSSIQLPEVEDLLAKLEHFEKLDTESANQIFNDIVSKAKHSEKSISLRTLNTKPFIKYVTAAAVIIGILTTYYFYHSHSTFNNEENIKAVTDTFQHRVNKSEKVTLEDQNGNIEAISEDRTSKVVDKEGNIVGKQNGNQLIYYGKVSSYELTYNTLSIPYGKKFELFLSDGTRVYLNAGSSIKYPVKFLNGQDRQVFLTGEAFFEVTKVMDDPFIIIADELNIRVLGTKFNVSTYPEDSTTDVVLVEGSVGLYDAKEEFNNHTFLLEPGSKGSFDKKDGKLFSETVATSVYTSWIDGELVFLNTSFENILKKMERNYNVTIKNNNKDIAREKFNARFRNVPLETILDYFKTAYGLEFEFQGNTIIIN